MDEASLGSADRHEPGAGDDVDIARLTGNVADFESANALPHDPMSIAAIVVLMPVGRVALMVVRRLARTLRGQR